MVGGISLHDLLRPLAPAGDPEPGQGSILFAVHQTLELNFQHPVTLNAFSRSSQVPLLCFVFYFSFLTCTLEMVCHPRRVQRRGDSGWSAGVGGGGGGDPGMPVQSMWLCLAGPPGERGTSRVSHLLLWRVLALWNARLAGHRLQGEPVPRRLIRSERAVVLGLEVSAVSQYSEEWDGMPSCSSGGCCIIMSPAVLELPGCVHCVTSMQAGWIQWWGNGLAALPP